VIGVHPNELPAEWSWEQSHAAAEKRQHKWDLRYLELAELVSGWSKDPSTQTGAVIVTPNNRVVSVGYNGFPAGMLDLPDRLNNREDKLSRVVHCEMNALLTAEKSVMGYQLYTWPFMSCDRCMVHMLQAGIRRFVYPAAEKSKLERWGPILEKAKDYAREMHAELVEIPRKEFGLND